MLLVKCIMKYQVRFDITSKQSIHLLICFKMLTEIFEVAKEKLKSRIVTWGYLPSKMDYFECLSKCDIIVSTSLHEFYGVAV